MTDERPSRRELEAMTVNERVYAVGRLHEYDRAKAEGDAAKIREILRSVYVDEDSIEYTVRLNTKNA